MLPLRIEGATHYLGAPKDWNPAVDGTCAGLAVLMENGRCHSAWYPSVEELKALLQGGSVILTVVGHQPPVALTVMPAPVA